MKNKFRTSFILAALGLSLTVSAQTPAPAPAPVDARQKVEMPPAAVAVFREEMQAKLQALHRVMAALAANDPAAAADDVEQQLGMSAMGQHAKLPRESRPGLYAPDALHALGRQSHREGSALAAALKAGDRPRIDAVLRDVTATCVACHATYRIH